MQAPSPVSFCAIQKRCSAIVAPMVGSGLAQAPAMLGTKPTPFTSTVASNKTALLLLLLISLYLPLQQYVKQTDCQGGAWKSSGGGKNVQVGRTNLGSSTTCSGTYSGGLCSGVFYTDVTFPTTYTTAPNVSLSMEKLQEPNGCMGGGHDGVKIYLVSVSETGFRAAGGYSPFGSACGGAYDAWSFGGIFSWIASN